MKQLPLNLVLADDDMDDCIFFKEALEELPYETELTAVKDGLELFRLLALEGRPLPDAIYLDLNMPCKTGSECLVEIKQNERLKDVPVFIFSTSFNPEVVSQLREKGADYYIRKPSDFSDLKKVILKSLDLILHSNLQPSIENFVINSKH